MVAKETPVHRRTLLATALGLAFARPGQIFAATDTTMAERIGASVSATTGDGLAPTVTERVQLAVADNLGTLTFASRASRGDHYLARMAERGGRAEARVLGTTLRAPYEEAAAALAYLIHFSETDDSDFRAELRASPTVMGPALALAQAPGVTGQDLMAAIAVGYTVLGGLAQPVGATQDDGLMAAGVWGPSASAAVAARLLRLNPVQTAHALALAAGAAGGTFQYYYDQTEEKRLIVARAARTGVEAAVLARAGEVGPRRAYEGQAGLYAMMERMTRSKPDISGVAEVIARMDGPLYIYPKFFSASSSITPSLESLAPLVTQGLRAGQVDRIVLRGDPARYAVVGGKLAHFETPGTLIGAKINYAYMLAFFLTHGAADAATLGVTPLDDPAVLALARRVSFEPVTGGAGEVAVHLRSGETRRVAVANQTPGAVAPVAYELRVLKLQSLTRGALGLTGSDRIISLANRLATYPSALAWTGAVHRLLKP
jgi:2-methylcitrate dehydratase PrpD